MCIRLFKTPFSCVYGDLAHFLVFALHFWHVFFGFILDTLFFLEIAYIYE